MTSPGHDDLAGPLVQAIRTGQDKCVASLLSAGADPNSVDDEGKTPLFILMENGGGNPEIMRILLKAGAGPNKVSWMHQQTPLHLASKKGYQVCVKGFLASGAKPDRRDAAGNTPCMFASRDGHVNIVRMLLRHGADGDAQNLTNETPVHFAAKGGHVDCMQELLETGAGTNARDSRGQTPLMIACKLKHQKVVELLLDQDCDVNGQDTNSGKTALHWAVHNGDVNIVTELLDAGADTNIKDKNWATPFMMALSSGRRGILELLLHSGCNLNITDRSYNTALHLAAADGQKDLIPLLVEAGVSVDIKGAGGLCPLMLAAYGGFHAVVAQLLHYGAGPDLMDRNRATALMYAILSPACDSDTHTTIKFLIRSNCDLNRCANLGKVLRHLNISLGDGIQIDDRLYSCVEVAYLRGKTAIFMMLIKAGCDTNSFTGDQMFKVSDSRNQDIEQRNRWYLLRCLQKEREQVKTLKELCRRPMLQFLSMKHVKGAVSIHTKIERLPFSDNLKSFLNYDDIDEVEAMYHVTLREKQKRPQVRGQTGTDDLRESKRNGLTPNGTDPSALRTSFRRSGSGFTRNSLIRQSLPAGHYHPPEPLASSKLRSTPVKSPNRVSASDLDPVQTARAAGEPGAKRVMRNKLNIHSLPRSLSSSKNRVSNRNSVTEVGNQTTPTRAYLRDKTSSSNNLEISRSRENVESSREALHNIYGRVVRKKSARESEYEKMETAYDNLRNSMIAQGSLSDMASSTSSLTGSRQRLNKRRGQYSQIDTNSMLRSPPLATPNGGLANGVHSTTGNGRPEETGVLRHEHMDTESPNNSRSSSDEVFHSPTSSKYRNIHDQMKMANAQKRSQEGEKVISGKGNLSEGPPRKESDIQDVDEWNLKSLRAPKLFQFKNNVNMDRQADGICDDKVIDDIIKITEEKMKHPKAHISGEERPLSPMKDETFKALFSRRHQQATKPLNNSPGLPHSGANGGMQSQSVPGKHGSSNLDSSIDTKNLTQSRFSYHDGQGSNGAVTSRDIMSPTQHHGNGLVDRTRFSLNLSDTNGLRSSLRSPTSPTTPDKKGVRFTTKITSASNIQNVPPAGQCLDEVDPNLKRWGTMTLDDPEVLDNSENFTSSTSMKLPAGQAYSRQGGQNSLSGGKGPLSPSRIFTSPRKPTSPRQSTNSYDTTRNVTSPTPKETTTDIRSRPRSAFSVPTNKHDDHRSANLAHPLPNQEVQDSHRLAQRLSARRPMSPMERSTISFLTPSRRPLSPTERPDGPVPFTRGARPYSSVRVQSSFGRTPRPFSPPPAAAPTPSSDRSTRKRLGLRSRDQAVVNGESPLTSPAVKKEVLFDARQGVTPTEPTKEKPGSKIKMAFLRSRSFRR